MLEKGMSLAEIGREAEREERKGAAREGQMVGRTVRKAFVS
jgi:hypothetical protein